MLDTLLPKSVSRPVVEAVQDFDPAAVNIPSGHYISGRLVPGDGPAIEVRRPSDGQAYADLPEAGETGVDVAVCDASTAQQQSGWGECPPRERGAVLRRWADLIMENRLELAQLEALGSTRCISEAYTGEVPFTAEAIRFFAECADKYSGDVLPTRSRSLGMLMPEPYGVVGAIAPWNFPLSMASWKCGPALAAGNAIVLKPSELTPFSTVRLAELALEAGLPPGIFNVVQGSGQVTGAALVRHPLVRKVSFTGSTQTGKSVMTDAAHHGMKPVTLELGGKSPQLVFNDAGDVDTVAQRITRGFMANAGQACVAGTRLIVQRGIAEALIAAVVRHARVVVPGVTWKANSRFAPLISQRQAEKVSAAVSNTVAAGAEVLCGGSFFDGFGGGFFYQPTVLIGLQAGMTALEEEVFGPVLTVQIFDDEEEGIALASHSVYGLAAGVHTMDIGQAMRATRRIAAGTVWINRYGRTTDFIVPTGGFNGSGIGKDLGRQAFEANLRHKSVLLDF
ncbi:aldehyde dehydrogenase family protein [Ottowia thiooxydans]|uniref:aldehyde dehydrogenase family protein n=1 Tax=Ottowia thiooxydans TaxID=219182 RepID=UPI000413768D|nr:aldehyde dehydrogenase family protein [Ottowia thiooxydans]